MKVKMNYGVELEDILETTEKLYNEARVDFDSSYKNFCKDLRFTNEELENDILKIQYMHAALIEFDTRIQDVFNILKGYEEVLKNPPVDNQQAVENVTTTDMEG